ncbi:hypothetical protein [Stutzerimonas xanthomarina]|uniref:Uncharacterized protein n=2 Tax=Stutzerimonas xanthomarina TaxID=271420 RepID=A0A1M5P6K7_9GAMM|nr:hypothetical protein [Stutzerimonas xanthomarina]MCP9338566.1 hypothetical protein [Stutzerimonas xanthomarina]SEH77440.1 hypothetical protein SAMN05216535_1807 [Stutzerimonas xanthomarina]SHG97416.1 hypothetical protein SAMN02744645_2003 [Stutzerimonas xanthomarina DSM 18231]
MASRLRGVETAILPVSGWHSSVRLAPAAIVYALLALLTGCASEPATPVTRDEALIHVRLVDKIDYKPSMKAFGLSRCANGVCVVEVLRENYPYCVGHEIRHVFEGDWHAGHESTEGC